MSAHNFELDSVLAQHDGPTRMRFVLTREVGPNFDALLELADELVGAAVAKQVHALQQHSAHQISEVAKQCVELLDNN